MTRSYEELSKEELVSALRDVQADLARARSAVETERVMHDLQVHQIELEMQNRALREAQSALEESRSRYVDLYDFAPVAYCTLEKDGRIADANLTATAYFGVDRSGLIGKPISALTVLEDRPLLRNHLRRCIAEKARVSTEVRLVVAGIGPVHFQLVTTPMLTPAGVVTGCKAAFSDISQVKRSEERLQVCAEASLYLASSFVVADNLTAVVRRLVPSMADLAFVDLYDGENGAQRVAVAAGDPARNHVVEALRRGPTPRSSLVEPLIVSEDAGAALSHLIDGAERDAVLKACAAHSVILVPMMLHQRALGLLALVTSESGRRLTDADLVFARDLAARCAMAIENALLFQAAERARQARQDILSIVSHELKNPLAGITLSADVMLNGAPPTERRSNRQQLDRIKRGAHHMSSMIDDLLDFAALETGRLTVESCPVPVGGIVHEAVELLGPLAGEKQITLSSKVETEGSALCDKNRVLQVLFNLGGNAIKFTPAGGEVVLSAKLMDGSRLVQFTVKDNGPGLPKQMMVHLFERYWQAQETARQGRGLGLFIAKGIIEAQGGAIWAESPAGKGTAFHFTLPVAAAAAKAEERALQARRS